MRHYGSNSQSAGGLKVNTPVCDFVREYSEKNTLRLHMPGHKGESLLGMEKLDITEITGADSLYEAAGIIRESEKNASDIFGCPTYYSTEGSSQCIRAMVYLAVLHAKKQGKKALIAAGRNVHKSFISAAALCDVDVTWIFPEEDSSYLSCRVNPEELDKLLNTREVTAVYITSPDYLGALNDIAELSKVCRKHGVLLLVDCAHGAYLKFLPESMHPVDLGADICCCSAHKTLPVLTGGAYLHLSESLVNELGEDAIRLSLELFGSTSPSYIILQSLDAANTRLERRREELERFIPLVEVGKKRLEAKGYRFYGDEPLKFTLCAKEYGYRGNELATALEEKGLVCEFSDADYLVIMLSPELGVTGLERLEKTLSSIPARHAVKEKAPSLSRPVKALNIREAIMSTSERVKVEDAEGRILAALTLGCPPAVPVLVCGEIVDKAAVEAFKYYGIESCRVVI